MTYTRREILETLRMTELEHFDVRTVTLGISLLDCAHPDPSEAASRVYEKLKRIASPLPAAVNATADDLGIRVANRRLSISPVSLISTRCDPSAYLEIARAIDRAASEMGFDFVGGYSALVHAGFTDADRALLSSIPEALSSTSRLCSSVNAGSSRTGNRIFRQIPWWIFSAPASERDAVSTGSRSTTHSRSSAASAATLRHASTTRNPLTPCAIPEEESPGAPPNPS